MSTLEPQVIIPEEVSLVPVSPPPLVSAPMPESGMIEALSLAHLATQIAATGYAQVIAVLAPSATEAAASVARPARGKGGAAAASARTASALGVLAGIEQHFVLPPEAQDVALAQERMYARTTAALGRPSAASVQPPAAHAVATVPKMHVFEHLGLVLGTVDAAGLRGLRSDGRVTEVVEAPPVSLIRPVATVAAKATREVTWGIRQLRVPELWAAGFTGEGVLIGHLDTGVDASHPVLAGAVAAYAEFDALGEQIPGAPPRDTDEHGTHTAGTIAGRAAGGLQIGVAPGAQLASATVIEGGNVVARILAGMNWVVAQGARVLSMSLGLRGFTPAFLTIVRLLRARGVLPVVAVGNEGPGTSRSPGNYPEALSVGASDIRGVVASFSGSQRFVRSVEPLVPDLVAPGDDVLSCIPGNRFARMSGTSMATPHVAGLAALLMQAAPQASIDEVERAIFGSCSLTPGMLPTRANRGLPDAVRAFTLLTQTTLPLAGAPPAVPPRVRRSRSKPPVRRKAKRKAERKPKAGRSTPARSRKAKRK